MSPMPLPPTFKPDKRSACLCGSGKLFKDCCFTTYKKPRPFSASRDALMHRRYGLALRIARADITRYTIWRKSHTEPLLPTDNPHLLWLLHTDINALAELVDVLMHCYRHTDQWDRLPAVLDRLEPNIQDSRWQHKIILFRALQAVGLDWNITEAAKRELVRLPPIGEIEDVDILTFYIDIYRDELTLKESLDLVNRVIELTNDPGIAFNYGALKGIFYLGLGELRDAERQLGTCIEQLRTANLPRVSFFVEKKLANALTVVGCLRLYFDSGDIQARRYLEEATYLYNKLLRNDGFTSLGEAEIYSEMADTYCFQIDWETARHYYNLALLRRSETGDLYKILSAKCDIELGDMDAARAKLREVDTARLHREEYVDYAFQYVALALKTGDEEDVELAEVQLDRSEPRWPYFRETRDRFKIALLSRRRSAEITENGRRMRMLSGILRYVNITPGVFGVSVNVNKLIENVIAEKRDKRRQRK